MKFINLHRPIKISLFVQISIIVLVSLVITNTFTSLAAITLTKQRFIDSFTISNDKILNRIANSFSSLNTRIIGVINTYRTGTAFTEYLSAPRLSAKQLFEINYKLEDYLMSMRGTSDTSNLSIVAIGNNGNIYRSIGEELTMSAEELGKLSFGRKAAQNKEKIFYSYSGTGLTSGARNQKTIVVSKQLLSLQQGNSYGTIYIGIDEDYFCSLYSDFVSDGNDMMVISSDGTIVSSNIKSIIGLKDNDLLVKAHSLINTNSPYKYITYNGSQCALIARYLPVYDMYLVSVVNMNLILNGYKQVQPLIFMGCFLMTFLAIMFTFIITRRITRPIAQLVSHIKKNSEGDFIKTEENSGNYEVKELQRVYNNMIDEIGRHMSHVLEEQNERRKAEIRALQAQINPHFLYNTLASIKYLSWQGNTQAVTETIDALILLLRNTIGKIDEKILVKDEIENLKSYVAINHVRYGEQIDVLFHTGEDCLECLIPKLIIQPFIENAFFHAYQIKHTGCIRVFINRRGQDLVCEIIDDGDGMDSKTYETIYEDKHLKNQLTGIGISNVHERLRMIYGDRYGVNILSKKGVGTSVTITIPYE